MNAIESSSVILLLLSESANSSQQVSREVEEAVRLNIPIIPVIMGSFKISKGLMYFINSHQWIDAANKPASNWIPKVLATLKPYNDSSKNPIPQTDAKKLSSNTTSTQPLINREKKHKQYISKRMIYLFVFILFVVTFLLVSKNIFIKQLASPSALFNHAVHLMDEGKYNDATSDFQYFIEEYPGHSLAPNAVYNTALIAELAGSSSAADLYINFSKTHPRTALAQIALYKAAIFYESNNMQMETLQIHATIAKDSTIFFPLRIPSLCKYADHLYEARAFEGAEEYYIECVQLDDSLRNTHRQSARALMLRMIDALVYDDYACRSAYRIALIRIDNFNALPTVTPDNVQDYAQQKANIESWLGKCITYNVESYFIASCDLASNLYIDFANSVYSMDPPEGISSEDEDEFYAQFNIQFYELEISKAVNIASVALEKCLSNGIMTDSERELIIRLATNIDNLSPGSTSELGIPDSIYTTYSSDNQNYIQLEVDVAALSTSSALDEALLDGEITPFEKDRIIFYASRLDELSSGASSELGIPDSIYTFTDQTTQQKL